MTKCQKLEIFEHTRKSQRFSMKLYLHFNPEVHKIESKIATVRTSHHCKYDINYHIIWIPKYRKPILTGKVVEVLKAIIEGQCQEMSISNLALEIMPDHLHLFVGAKPTATPFKIIHKLKGNTSIQLRRCFPEIKEELWGGEFWSDGGYIGTVGERANADIIRNYIKKQGRSDNQLKLVNFIDVEA